MDGFGYGLWTDSALYRGRQTILDGVLVYHFGNAISKEAMREKLLYEYRRGGKSDEVGSDMWFTGIMPPDMVIEDYKGDYPDVLSNHPEKDKARIKVTEVKPVYRFDFAEES
jgi:hypothetical protein